MEETRSFQKQLDELDLWYVKERLVERSMVDPARVEILVQEFKRFLAIVRFDDPRLPMLSDEVDEVWHVFILFTKEYAEFCEAAFGRYLHHAPRTSRSTPDPTAADRFQIAYQRRFGALTEPWVSALAAGASCGPSSPNCSSGTPFTQLSN